MTRIEDFNAYINYDACDDTDMKGKSAMDDYPEPKDDVASLEPLEFDFLAPWHAVPLLSPKQGVCKAIFRDSSPLLNSSALISSSESSQSILFAINPSIVFSGSPAHCPLTVECPIMSDDRDSDISDISRSPSPSIYPSSVSGFDTNEHGSRFSSPLSDSPYLSAADSDDCSSFSDKTSAISSPASSTSSLNDPQRLSSPETFQSPSVLSSPIANQSDTERRDDFTRPGTRNAKQNLKNRRSRNRASPIPMRRRCVLSSQGQADQDSQSEDFSSKSFVLDKNGKRRWMCLCGKSFTRFSDRKRHSEDSTSCPLAKGRHQERSPGPDPRFVCEHCNKVFSRHDSLDRHQKNRRACPGAPKLNSSRREGMRRMRRREYGDDDDSQ